MSRPTVLLLHAFPLDHRMWDGIRPALEEAGYPVVAPDLPGPEPELGFAAWARRILDQMDGPFVPAGSSMGGYLALELWRQASGRIPALALVGTRATADTPEQRAARDDSIMLLGEGGREPFLDGLLPRLFAPDADPAVVARARELALAQPLTGLVAAQETIRDRPDSTRTLAAVDAPALVVVGEEDAITPPADAEAMAAGLPHARLVRVAGAGHLVALERPAETAAALLALLEEGGA